MRVLIVGCGYVGQAVGAELARHGHTVWGVRRTPEMSATLLTLGIKPLIGDITRPEGLAEIPPRYDWVVLCASAAGGGVEQYRRTYLEGTRNLLHWLAAAPSRKLVYTSSTSVYGQNQGECVDETSATEPLSETGQILLETENLLLSSKAIILRVAGIYGPGRGYWLKQLLSGEARLEGQGERFLNMIHRDDVAGAIIAALERGQPGRIYNAVDDEQVSQRVLYEWLSNKLGLPLPPIASEPPAAIRKRGATNKRVSNQRLRAELGYQFKFPTFRQGY